MKRLLSIALLAPLLASAAGGDFVDRSGTITTGGTSQTLAAADPSRGAIVITNPSTESEVLCVNVTSAASCSTPGSWLISPGGSLTLKTGELVTVVAATTGHKFTAKERALDTVLFNPGSGGGGGGGAVTVADGADAALGAKADAAAAADDSTASLISLLKKTNQNITANTAAINGTNGQLPTTVSGTAQVAITRPANTTAYSAGDVVGGVVTFSTGMTSGQRIMIVGTDLLPEISALPTGMTSFKAHCYSATPGSAIADNSPWTFPSGDRATYLGSFDIGTAAAIGTGTTTVFAQTDGINKMMKLSTASLYCYLVTTGGYTPAANSEIYNWRLQIVGF